MAALAFSSITALAALVGFAMAVALVRRFPPIGIALIALIVIPLWDRPALFRSPIVSLSGASFYIADMVAIVLFAAGLLQLSQLRANLRAWFVPWTLFGAFIAVALIRAVLSDGPASGFNSARMLLFFFWAMTWVMGVRPDRLRLSTGSLVLGWVLVVVALYHGVKYGFGGANSLSIRFDDGYGQTGRVLVAPQSLILLLCAAILILGRSRSGKSGPPFYLISALVFAGIVVIAQHRSVWAAGVAGSIAVMIWSARTRARKQLFVQLALGGGVLLVAGSFGLLSESAIAGSASDRQTMEWRSTGWRILISEAVARGPVSIVFGEPSASTFYRELNTRQFTSVSAHNWYLDILLYVGALGALLLVAVLVSALVKSREVSAAWTFVLAAVAAYGLGYSVEWYVAPWLGAAIVGSLGVGRIAETTGTPPRGSRDELHISSASSRCEVSPS